MIRNDFVSNSSSCSFIVKVNNQQDLDQLKKPDVLETLKKYAHEVSDEFRKLPYGTERRFKNINDINIGDFIRIYLCEDDDYFDRYIDDELIEISESLNKDYNQLQIYRDNDAHISIGENYPKEVYK